MGTALALTACSSIGSLAPREADVTVEAQDARAAMDGVQVSEENPLRLYTAVNASSAAPTQVLPSADAQESGAAIRNRTLSEIGYRANVDPALCEPVRDLAVSYLAAPAPGSTSYKAVSKDNLTVVTVTLEDSMEQARRSVDETTELVDRCEDMKLSVSGVNIVTRVTPLDVTVDSPSHSSAMVSGAVMGSPLKSMMVQGHAGNAVVTVTYFDSDLLISGGENPSAKPTGELEYQAADVANEVLGNLRDQAA